MHRQQCLHHECGGDHQVSAQHGTLLEGTLGCVRSTITPWLESRARQAAVQWSTRSDGHSPHRHIHRTRKVLECACMSDVIQLA